MCSAKRTRLYAGATPITVDDEEDAAAQQPYDVYRFDLNGGVANPFGIVTTCGRVHIPSMHSDQLPLPISQSVRLGLAHRFKPRVCHDGQVISFLSALYTNFYHFSIECLQRLFLLKDVLQDPGAALIMPKSALGFQTAWLEFLGLGHRVILVEDGAVVRGSRVVTSTFAANSSNQHSGILRGFRVWIRAAPGLRTLSSQHPQRIFVGRPAGWRRGIVNSEAVADVCSAHGFASVDMDQLPLGEQIRMFANATHIVGLHGAALSHLAFAAPAARVIELKNRDFKFHFFEKICRGLDISYTKLNCQPAVESDDPATRNHADIIVDTQRLTTVIRESLQ